MQTHSPKIRIVTAAALFDGHDAAINIMRRVIQASGAEVIHLGHNRSVQEIVECAIQEDVQAIAITSYQGGHVEFFKYMYDLLAERGASHIKLFGGGGGTILPSEADELHAYGIARIYSPDDGRAMGLQGMIDDLLGKIQATMAALPRKLPLGDSYLFKGKEQEEGQSAEEPKAEQQGNEQQKKEQEIAALISLAENYADDAESRSILEKIKQEAATSSVPILGITGTGGAGKSSLIDELVRRFLLDFPDKRLALLSVDPSKRKTGGALLGDRIRMNAINSPNVYMRSLATRQSNLALSRHVPDALAILKIAGFDLIILETSGIGQSDTEIADHSDLSLYVMTPEFGAASQLEKIDMLDFADLIAINKFDKLGAADALRDVKKQVRRNRNWWDMPDEQIPVFGTIASQFNDPGTNRLYKATMQAINKHVGKDLFISTFPLPIDDVEKTYIIPPARTRYLSEISESNRRYDKWVNEQSLIAQDLGAVERVINMLEKMKEEEQEQIQVNNTPEVTKLQAIQQNLRKKLDSDSQKILETWQQKQKAYQDEIFIYKIRNKNIQVATHTISLSGNAIPKISLPRYQDLGDILRWNLQENVPGEFPYTAGVFPFKRENEDPTRMFAGEGNPERTNRRFHYVSKGLPAIRLSTAFDSVTLYGENPDYRPDIYGKVGNSGVSVCCLDDAKKLYSGFNLCLPNTSVSMTINGPAAIITAFFLNAAIDQQCELYIKQNGLEDEIREKIKLRYAEKNGQIPTYNSADGLPEGNNGLGLLLLGVTGNEVLPLDVYERVKAFTLSQVRGTVQADILKEDQAQNTCIFSTEFSLRIMGDVQQYFIDHQIQNFYSVSISGYHIAEAGANPISQLAFTLSNGFTYIEYYLSRGMNIDDFAPNLSFFFSNGTDPEYAVIGRVARRIWAKAMKYRYGANERSQKLKYHIQTSGRSLHAQEISFNDIRTTLQALYAIYDNCNSLHTNAYDEAITTPTEESVRRAMAIQLIINQELGLAKNQNPLQGSFIIEELTDLVEEAVLCEFDRITERGGVLGAMERMYQRGKIQDESMHYEMQKHTGKLPIVGVNTFLSEDGSPTILPREVIRSTKAEKEAQIETLQNLHTYRANQCPQALLQLQQAAMNKQNLFAALMEASKYCSLGQITNALYEVGGQYRRSM